MVVQLSSCAACQDRDNDQGCPPPLGHALSQDGDNDQVEYEYGVCVANMYMLDLFLFGQQLVEVSTRKRWWQKAKPPVHKVCVRAY